MADIKNYKIFEAGTWNGMPFNEGDLEDIAKNFIELGDVQKVPLKLGHNEQQPVLDGQPSLGWVQNLRRVGSTLVADFVDMPNVVKEAIAKRLYRFVSIELLLGVKRGEKTFNHVLDAVAILGSDQPAVNTLDDLSHYLASRSFQYDECGRRLAFSAVEGVKQDNKGGNDDMDDKQVQAMVDTAVNAAVTPLREEVGALKEENETMRVDMRKKDDTIVDLERDVKKFTTDEADRQAQDDKRKLNLARDEANEVLEEAVKEKKITPAQRDQAVAMFGIDDDVRVLKLDLAELRKYYSLGEKTVKLTDDDTTSGGSDDDDDGRKHKSVFKEIDHRIRIERAKSKSTYGEASRVVFTEDPDLHREYLTTDTPVAVGGDS